MNSNKVWKRLTKEEINEFPLKQYNGTVFVVSTENEVKNAVKSLKNELILGFDTETRPVFRKGLHYLPALLQLSGKDGAFLFQLKKTGIPDILINLLENPNIIKAGVSIDYDIAELRKLKDFEPQGFFDIGKKAKQLGIQNLGLRGLAAAVLGYRISKGASTSNWENSSLTESQIKYAATDAWVGREIYMALNKM